MPEEIAANRFDADPKVGALAFAAYSYLALGHADRALQAVEAALVLAREIGDPLSVYFAIAAKGRVQRRRCDSEMLAATVDALHAIWTDFHLPMGEAEALMNRGWLLAERCAAAEGIPLFEQGLAIWDQTGMANHLTEFHSVLAEMCAKANQPARGLELIEGALAYADRTGERYHEAELYRLRGELRLQQDADHITEAADDFRTAIQIARRQAARSLELRAAISSCRLWRGCGKKAKLAEARAHLAETYAWFTEGFGTRDMQEARALLDAVSAA